MKRRVGAPEPKSTRGLSPLVPLEDALNRLSHAVDALHETEAVGLDVACGRVLAEPIYATVDQPAFDRAMMDGVAVRGVDCHTAGQVLVEQGLAPAGAPFHGAVEQGRCVRVMTGGVVPEGADSVVPLEDIETLPGAPDLVSYRVGVAVRRGQHVALRGSERAQGELLMSIGARLSAARVGVIAATGKLSVRVYRRPRVAILPTGSEVIPIADEPRVGQVRNSNAWALEQLFTAMGADVRRLPVVDDEQGAIDEALSDAMAWADVVVTCGGVSMGDHDLVVGAVRRLEAEVLFHRVRLKPGKPVLFARRSSTFLLGLPGNPVSALVCGRLFGTPLIARLGGQGDARWLTLATSAGETFASAGARAEVRPAAWSQTTPPTLQPVNIAGSADLSHFSDGAEWVLLQPHEGPVAAGQTVQRLHWTES